MAKKFFAEFARKKSELAAILGLLAELTSHCEEEDVLRTIGHIFTTMYGPDNLAVASVPNNKIIAIKSSSEGCHSTRILKDVLARLDQDYEIFPGKDRFAVRLCPGKIVNGLIVVSGLAFPQKITSYLSQALNLSLVCSLAIANARARRGYLPICSFCKKKKNLMSG